MKRFWLLLAVLVCWCTCAMAQASVDVQTNGGTVQIVPAELDGENWLFLPAFADAQAMDDESLNVMQSKNLRALFLFSDDPVNHGRAHIDGSEKHTARATASMALISPDGTVDYTGKIRQLRGRGNGTWSYAKKPYQIKLEEKADLLQTGDPDEASRTWVLLAEATDPTLLHNRITFDLALEMGMEDASRSEFVDLYYDGEYRGTYLLCEKTEIGSGRVDEVDFDGLIESWNSSTSLKLLENTSPIKEYNRFGSRINYLPSLIDHDSPDAGAYLLEMENEASTLSDPCWFRLSDGSAVALKNPEMASRSMLLYVSERLEEARQTLQNGGVHPETGRTIHDDFDVEAFARIALLNELSYNVDGFTYSSSFFVLPAGQTRFRPGPVWDFDLAYRYQRDGRNAGGVGLKDLGGWLWDFYRVPEFVSAMQRQMENQLAPLVQQVLLGDRAGTYLRPLTDYETEIAASRAMNERLHGVSSHKRQLSGANAQEDMQLLRQLLSERCGWLLETLNRAAGGAVQLQLDALYAHTQDGTRLILQPWSGAELVSHAVSCVEEATEESYALWEVEAVLSGCETAEVWINGTPVTGEFQPDGTLRVCARFEDPSYRPVDYYGDDIGLIYDPDVYAASYPEIAAEYEGDPQGLMDYFMDEGVYEGHRGNAFFDPAEILLFNSGLWDTLGEDWWSYYWDFLYYGHEEGWLLRLGRRYIPQVEVIQ